MGARKVSVELHVLVLLALINWITPGNCQEGFLSIDCGSEVDYVDDTTGIKWVSDSKYISTGKIAKDITRPRRYVNIVNERQVKTLRYFDEGRNRNCYVLPVKPETTYLLRATFFYGNWRNAGPSSFRIFINATAWLSIASGSGTAEDAPYAYEAVVYSTGSKLNFCLVRGVGAPFIAALEVRALSVGMYDAVVGTTSILLSLYDRENCGVPPSDPLTVRYPDDPFDRIWYSGGSYTGASYIVKKGLTTSANAPNQPPAKVMEDAWIFYSDNSTHNQNPIFVYYEDFGTLIPPDVQISFKMYGYFQDLDGNASSTNVREMDYIINGLVIKPFNISSEASQQENTPFPITSSDSIVNVTLRQGHGSKLEPMVNALETYFAVALNTTVTSENDVEAVMVIQRGFNLTSWTGDPCIPMPFEWVNCSLNTSASSDIRVSKLFLADKLPPSLAGSGHAGNLSSLKSLTALTYLNLSSNRLTLSPPSLKELPSLAILDLSKNLLSGDVGYFMETINIQGLRELYAQQNSFEGNFPVSFFLSTDVNIVDFSNNYNINGTLDLTEWIDFISRIVHNGAVHHNYSKLFILVNNNIMDVSPNTEILESTIQALLTLEADPNFSFDHSLLLGGNPFCKQSTSKSLVVQYLCRFSTNGILIHSNKQSSTSTKKLAIAVGTSVGTLLLLISCMCIPILLKLRKQTYALIEIEEALAQQKVQPPFYSYAELRGATDDFSASNKLGQGAFGAVYKGVRSDGTILAIKKLFLAKDVDDFRKQALTEFLNEVVLITGIKHRNLIQLKGCCIKEEQRMLVYEYAENGNLAEALWGANGRRKDPKRERIRLDWGTRFHICVGVARGLSYLHEEVQPKIIHRDIKSANILLDKNLNPKIADFGLARSFIEDQSQDFTQLAGTLGYFAPEYATQGQLTEKADVFSFGVLVLEIVGGRKCINHTLPIEEIFLLNMARRLYNQDRLLDLLEPAIRDCANLDEVMRVINVALLCLQIDPGRRPSMSQVVTLLRGSMDTKDFLDIPIYQHTADYMKLYPSVSARSSSTAPNTASKAKLSRSLGCRKGASGIYPTMEVHSPNSINHGGSLELSRLSGR